MPSGLSDEKSGKEAYLLRAVSKNGEHDVVAAGATPRGTKLALAALMKAIQVEGKSAFVPAGARRVGQAGDSPSGACTSTAGRSILPTRSGIGAKRSGSVTWTFSLTRASTCSISGRSSRSCRSRFRRKTRRIWKSAAAWSIMRRRSTAWRSGSCNAPIAWRRIAAAWPIPGGVRTGGRRKRI